MNPLRLAAGVALAVALVAAPLCALAVEAGDAAPGFALPDGQGGTITLTALRGRVVYVDFWASWCGPCRRSFPWLNAMQQKYGAQGFTVVAINVDKKRADAQRFLDAVPAQFAIAYDEAGTTPAAFDVKGMPSSFLVDARGNVVLVEFGFRDDRKSALEEAIRRLLPVPGRFA
jgi:cytochrome c biogenesis protein CcmG/thiol:disulfide interchange protein DsbE